MSREIEDIEYHKIKQYILDPDNAELSPIQKNQLDRIKAASDILDNSPRLKHAADLLRFKFKDLSIAQAYRDVAIARRLFTSNNSHEYDFWHTWLLNDIASTIENCRKMNPPDNATIAKCHANLIKALGEKPGDNIDPKLLEKNTFIIPIQVNNTVLNLDMKEWMKLDPLLKQKLTNALYGTDEIDDVQTDEIMES